MHFRIDNKENLIYLERKYCGLYTNIFYLSPADTILNRITEYDLKSAGFNALKERQLVHTDIINRLELLEKERRNEAIGMMIRKDKSLGKKIQRTVTEARREFFEANEVKDIDVLSIKNDAIFIIGRRLKNLEFGNMKFIEKNIYTSYHLFDKIEMYYNSQDERIDIKGINDKILGMHDNYMLEFLRTCFNYIEKGNYDKLKKFLIDFSISYKSHKLHPGYYRELSSKNNYQYKETILAGDREMVMVIKNVEFDELGEINIAFNYLMYVLPLMRRYL